ncbi:uncharacterized protein LOC124812548 [Hydra vulgaris]|uniref:uncharacterized protein LOC124812548 n=1 Tax=Hydra vulgaris TaxID=6087 RepID=UPI001F5FC0AA|nr:uncharacterized protein LOC124812548 [Hydra vulgaris]
MCSGDYIYLGLATGIKNMLQVDEASINNNINLIVNLDGLPLFKSSKSQLWPLLCQFGCKPPFPFAFFCGKQKPNSSMEFLRQFLEEFKMLSENSLVYKDNFFNVSLKFWTCNAPARAFIKCIKLHNAYHGCERCIDKGEWQGRVVFNQVNFVLHSDEQFSKMYYKDHQVSRSPLIDFNLSCVSTFVLHYMHLVCLGVVRRIIIFWTEGPN